MPNYILSGVKRRKIVIPLLSYIIFIYIYINLVNNGINMDKLPTSTGEFTEFLNHQQYVLLTTRPEPWCGMAVVDVSKASVQAQGLVNREAVCGSKDFKFPSWLVLSDEQMSKGWAFSRS